MENRLTPVAAIHHVIDRAGIFHSQLPRHALFFYGTILNTQYQELTPFRPAESGAPLHSSATFGRSPSGVPRGGQGIGEGELAHQGSQVGNGVWVQRQDN